MHESEADMRDLVAVVEAHPRGRHDLVRRGGSIDLVVGGKEDKMTDADSKRNKVNQGEHKVEG